MLEVCPECGYSRTGLPPETRCPECGLQHDEEHLILFGFEPDNKGNVVVDQHGHRSPTYLLAGAALPVVVLLGISFLLPRLGSLQASLLLVLISVTAAWASWHMSRRHQEKNARLPAPVQLRLSPDGYAQRIGIGTAQLTPWPKKLGVDWRLNISPGRKSRYVFQVSRGLGVALVCGFNIELAITYDELMEIHQKVIDWATPNTPAT